MRIVEIDTDWPSGPNFSYDRQLDDIHEQYMNELRESLGTLQIGEYAEAIDNLVEQIIEDIKTKKYTKYKITKSQINESIYSHLLKETAYIPEKLSLYNMISRLYETTENDFIQPHENIINYFKHIDGVSQDNPLYVIEYFPKNISWLYKLIVVINPSINERTKNVNAVAYPHDNVLTEYSFNRIENATISVNICHNTELLKNDIYHEIRHYYEDFLHQMGSLKKYYDGNNKNRIDNTSKENKLSHNFFKANPEAFYNLAYYKQFCKKELTDNLNNVISVVINLMYWCSKREVGPHMENIAKEIRTYIQKNNFKDKITTDFLINASKTYKVYYSLNIIAKYYKDNVSLELSDQIYNTNLGKTLEKIYFKHYKRKKILYKQDFKLKLIRDIMIFIIQRIDKILKTSASIAEYFKRHN